MLPLFPLRFLFQGDGKAVSIPTRESSIYSRPRSSIDMSLPSSYQRSQSSSSFPYQQVSVGPSDDSGFKDSPISHSRSPAQDVPPPVRLDKHPSIRRQRSGPCHVPHSSRCSASPSGSYGAPSQSYSHSVGSFNEEEMFDEQRAVSRQSVSPQDEGYSENEESGSGQFRMDPDLGAGDHHHHYETMPPHIPEQHEYETMRHPSLSGSQQQAHEDYIKMIPAFTNGLTIPRPQIPSNYDVPPPFRKRNGNSPASSSASPSSNYENSGPLPTIEEAPKVRGHPEVYENVPVMSKVRDEDFVHYHPNYENAEIKSERRRESNANSDTYQNVTVIDDDLPFRSRTRSMEKGQYTPPRSKNPHLHYAQRQSPATVSPPGLPPRIPVVGPTSDL